MSATLLDIQNKIRRIVARPSTNQLSNTELNSYINCAWIYDIPQHLKLETFKTTFQFVTEPNKGVYNFDTDLYLQAMPPVYCSGYQIAMSQSREQFSRANPKIQFMQKDLAIATALGPPYSGTLSNVPILMGYQPNPATNNVSEINYNVLISAYTGAGDTGPMVTLVDDGANGLRDLSEHLIDPVRGSVDYIGGNINIFSFISPIPAGNTIIAQYIPCKNSRPTSALFFQDQITLYPTPDQAYTVSFECFKKPTALLTVGQVPELKELWQLIAYVAADKIFSDSGDMENVNKYRPLLEEQLRLCNRRTITQYSSERTATIFTEQVGQLSPFFNVFAGM
jgi:hypothetical protein